METLIVAECIIIKSNELTFQTILCQNGVPNTNHPSKEKTKIQFITLDGVTIENTPERSDSSRFTANWKSEEFGISLVTLFPLKSRKTVTKTKIKDFLSTPMNPMKIIEFSSTSILILKSDFYS